MGQLSLGIDIGEEMLSAAVVAGTGRDAQVVDCSFSLLPPGDANALAKELPLLLDRLGLLKSGRCMADRCMVGISLSLLSLRNLALPFKEERKIRQVLPLELEEQLLRPMDEQIIATVPTGGKDAGTTLLAAAAEKSMLRNLLSVCRSAGLEPDRIVPAAYVLADRLCRTEHTGNTFLLLHADLCAVQAVLVRQGEIVFLRCLAWPDAVFTHALFHCQGMGVASHDPLLQDDAARSLGGLVQRSLDYFSFQSGMDIHPDYFVLSGPLQCCHGFQNNMEACLEMPGRLCDLVQGGAASVPLELASRWHAAFHDASLALALQQTKAKDAGLDFRQGEFALPKHLFRSKRQTAAAGMAVGTLLLAALGCQLADYRQLQKRHDDLTAKMKGIFQESFPGISPGQDPLMQMRSRLKSMDASATAEAVPIFTDEKRILAILADISARIPASIDLHVERMIIDQNSVKIKGKTDAFNNVNAMQSMLVKSPRYAAVNIVSATKGKKDEGILFEISLLLKNGGNS